MIGNAIAGLYAGGVPPVTTAYESIATVTVGSGGASSIDFTSIPSTFTHLQLRAIIRTNRASTTGDYSLMRFNGLSGGSDYYAQHVINGNGSTVSAGADGTYSAIIFERAASASQTSGVFGVCITDILDYTNTNKNKVVRSLSGLEDNSGTTNSNVRLSSGMLLSTPAITSISILPGIGTSFSQYSSFALYGIKGA